MRTVFLDFETYYDKEYSLRKITPVEYILDQRFEALGCAVKDGPDAQPYWVEGPDLPDFFASLTPEVTSLVTHNALFDACICAWRYNFTPKLIVDTLGVSRAVLGHVLKSHALHSVASHLELGAKGSTVSKVAGLRLHDLKLLPSLHGELVDYALNDVELCAGIYRTLVMGGRFPLEELLVMDMVLRCAVTPKLHLDENVLAEHLAQVQEDKNTLLAQTMLLGGSSADLMSNERFAELLRQHGVEPPHKISKTTGLLTYAFAKTDAGMVALEEHENPAVQALVAARVGYKSTIEETRTKRLLNISRLQWPGNPGSNLCPVPLMYGAAHTHRLGGGWKLNFQNLGRKSKIRRALIAPPGHVIVAADAAQIEARGVAAVCGQHDLTAQFAAGEDVYASFASSVFGRTITKRHDPGERFIGKIGVLQLGFQSGWATFKEALRVQSLAQLGEAMSISDEEAQRVVNSYRQRYPAIKQAWYTLNTVGIQTLYQGGEWEFGPCKFMREKVLLPSGLHLHYHNIRRMDDDYGGHWWFDYAQVPQKIYGGKLLENIIQALARIATMQAGVRIQKRLELALQVHDELTYVVPEGYVDEARAIIEEEMSRPLSWWPSWPLAVEINVGRTYGDTK